MNHNQNKRTFIRRYIIPAAGVLLLITAAMVYIYFTQETITKPDPASENIIREAAADRLVYRHIIKDPNSLTDEYFAYITMIIIEYKDLSDIKLLEKFTNLQHLEIIDIHYPSNKIPKWMSLLAKLGLFNIKKRFPMDLSPLANLSKLSELNLSGINVSDIKPLANLKNLQFLDLENTQVSDIKPLANLKNIQELCLGGTQVRDISVLTNLTNLEYLSISETEVSNIEPLANLKNLNTLVLSGTNVSDEQIAELKNALPDLNIER